MVVESSFCGICPYMRQNSCMMKGMYMNANMMNKQQMQQPMEYPSGCDDYENDQNIDQDAGGFRQYPIIPGYGYPVVPGYGYPVVPGYGYPIVPGYGYGYPSYGWGGYGWGGHGWGGHGWGGHGWGGHGWGGHGWGGHGWGGHGWGGHGWGGHGGHRD